MTDPWWLQKCLENLAKIPGATLCSEQHCNDMSRYVSAVCNCQPPYSNGCASRPMPGCCSYTAPSPVFVMSDPPCYCCCGDTVGIPTVATGDPEGRPAAEIAVGDAVRVALDPDLKTWALMPARFSAGTGGGAPALAVRFGDPHESETVLANPDQLFLVPGARLKRAARLVAGEDALVRPDGGTVQILAIDAVTVGGAQHRIATSDGPASTWAGHLIVVNGLVCGDYALQLADLETLNPAMLADGSGAEAP